MFYGSFLTSLVVASLMVFLLAFKRVHPRVNQIHDIAPEAQLAFHTAGLGSIHMAQGIQILVDAGCHVIVDDIRTYIMISSVALSLVDCYWCSL